MDVCVSRRLLLSDGPVTDFSAGARANVFFFIKNVFMYFVVVVVFVSFVYSKGTE